MSGSATSPFGSESHEAAGFTLSHWAYDFASLPTTPSMESLRAFDTPLRREDLASRPGSATQRTGAYCDGTLTR